MTADNLIKFAKANPYKPFRIHFTLGGVDKCETAWNENSCSVGKTTCIIRYPDGSWTITDVSKITRIEALEVDDEYYVAF
jgi:hypothetical protein